MRFTRRNHYNPCFWTALWNRDYYDRAIRGLPQPSPARQQKVSALSVKSDRLFETSVNNIHFDKGLGIAEISREAAEDFVRRHHPDTYVEFLNSNASAEYPVFLDFEEILTAIEQMPPYEVLLDAAKRGTLRSPEEKAFLACFVVLQFFRSHAIMQSMIEWHAELQRSKFEHFVTLKWLLSDTDALFSLVQPLVTCQWTLYSTESDQFPLCDSPVLAKPHSMMAALSPRLLLEIEHRFPASEDEWRVQHSIKPRKLAEFRRRTIGNTFREIIFEDSDLLADWQSTREFRERVGQMRDAESYNRLLRAEGDREIWSLNAFGNQG